MPHTSTNVARGAARVLPLIIGIVLLLVVLAGFAMSRAAAPQPRRMAVVDVPPESPRHAEDTWVWMESTDEKPGRLIQYRDGRLETIAEKVTTFDLSGSGLYWIAAGESGWGVYAGGAARDARQIWSGPSEPRALKATGDSVYWLSKVPGVDPNSALPPLGDSLALWTTARTGGEPKQIAALMESEAGEIVTIRPESILLTCFRPGIPGATVFYDVALESGQARRLFGTEGRNEVAATPDGSLHWAAPSKESSEPGVDVGVLQRTPDGRITRVIDWMSPLSRVYASGSDVYLVEGNMEGTLWPARPGSGLPKPVSLPEGFAAAAVSDGKALLFRREPPGRYTLYEVDLR